MSDHEYLAVVVREYDDTDTKVCETELEARMWLVKALYLVEDGVLTKDAPTPGLAALRTFARDYGWTADIQPIIPTARCGACDARPDLVGRTFEYGT